MNVLTIPTCERDHIKGQPHALVSLLEYGDYECLDSSEACAVIKRITEIIPNDLMYAFRNYPLAREHPHSLSAALAAEAAAMQNKFWAMHSMLFTHQYALQDEDILAYAETLDLDLSRFFYDWHAESTALRVHEDFVGGMRSGVDITPTFFINGQRHQGSYDYGVLLSAIEQGLALRPNDTLRKW